MKVVYVVFARSSFQIKNQIIGIYTDISKAENQLDKFRYGYIQVYEVNKEV